MSYKEDKNERLRKVVKVKAGTECPDYKKRLFGEGCKHTDTCDGYYCCGSNNGEHFITVDCFGIYDAWPSHSKKFIRACFGVLDND